ncbi:hypothetical protein NLU13_2696 [Sarocladium strictum]|uniref:Putative glutathione-dependent formaldehyde-activating enzyme n=1 Tax=Sarocladium strictum TaxID=5046 RepID=A0AA39GKZ1_SARSR|nr:hypothetical protein NLU13_2696 [Sarocladium strictum]
MAAPRSPIARNKSLIATATIFTATAAAAAAVIHSYRARKSQSMAHLHPSLSNGVKKGDSNFAGGTLRCLCSSRPVEVTLGGNVLHNHACGCSKCWKPEGALFAVIAVIPRDQVRVSANCDKLRVVDESAAIQRHACASCGVHMFGRIETDHPFQGLDFVHTELSSQSGWQEPQFAAFVSSIVEQGYDPGKMGEVRSQLRSMGLEPYDALSPPLMDAIAAWTAQKKAKL